MVSPGRAATGQAGKSTLIGKGAMSQSEKGTCGLNMKTLVVDSATRRKIICNYLKQKRLENTSPPGENIIPKAIFWLKKKVGFPEDRRK